MSFNSILINFSDFPSAMSTFLTRVSASFLNNFHQSLQVFIYSVIAKRHGGALDASIDSVLQFKDPEDVEKRLP